MIRDCEKGKIDLILTKSVSRFARNTVDSLKYVRKLKAMNIAVLLCAILLFSLSACGGGKTDGVTIPFVESETYSQEDIDSAVNTIIK